MFKGASSYEQGRTRRVATESTRNEGIDPTTFKGGLEAERDRLVSQKSRVAAELTEVNARLKRARGTYSATGRSGVTRGTLQHWESIRVAKVKQLAALDKKLTEVNTEIRSARVEGNPQRDPQAFGNCFARVAKEMLAEPVYERLRIAALHMMSEGPASN